MPRIEFRTSQIGLQDISQVPRDNGARVKWTKLREDPTKLALVVETMAKRILWQGHSLNKTTVNTVGEPSLVTGVSFFYPGKLTALKSNLGQEIEKKPNNYWSDEIVEANFRQVIQEYGAVTEQVLRQHKRYDLVRAINNYPGKLTGLKRKLGAGISKRPTGEWNKETVEQEARKFVEEGHELRSTSLMKYGRSDLLGAIGQHYPGRLKGLQEALKIDKAQKSWTVETIKEAAETFFEKHGELNGTVLRRKQSDLRAAIVARYPGGLRQLQSELGANALMRAHGYWNSGENVEKEVLAHLKNKGKLTFQDLRENGLSGLAYAISHKYPGGIKALRGKLGIAFEPELSAEKANADLDDLLTGGTQ